MSDLDRPLILLDNDGVLTDADEHGVAYGRRYGELMAARYGATREAWAEANAVAFRVMLEWYETNADRFEDASFFEALYQVELYAAFAHLGLTPPDWESEGRLLMRRLLFECPAASCTLFPGAREAVEALAAAGYRLCMASNAHSLHCEGVLTGCGLRGHFICAFGPDLVNCATKSAEFYRRLCAHVGVRPAQGILVDDGLAPLAMAAETGMRTVLVDRTHPGEGGAAVPDETLGDIAELPAAVARLARG